MKLLILATIFALTFIPILGQQERNQNEKIITACSFQLTSSAKTANFRFNFLYMIEVAESGGTKKIEEFASTQKYKKYKFVRDDLFLDCMNKWHLVPVGKYFISFDVGTASRTTKGLPFNYVRITDPSKQVLIIELWNGESNQ